MFRRGNLKSEFRNDDKHVTAVAAAAFSIHSIEQAAAANLISRPQSMRRKNHSTLSERPTYGGDTSVKRSSFGEDGRRKEGSVPLRGSSDDISSKRTVPQTQGHQKQIGIPIQHNNKANAEAWEKAKLKKIQKRYEKIKSQILSWEREKKIHAKMHMEKKKNELEKRRIVTTQHYNNKIASIDKVAQGALTQLEDKRRKELSRATEKANKIRKTGKVPPAINCFCFSHL
ncbi:hypothetical protein HN51_057276 [Arachis hypogaea]|uniref:Remorin C-terminal domain-containing protein n=2 Tax=Arachis TaxID=3817 RepID=A0A444WWK7_ARAHY|nr:uncharacterized protein LOC112782949 isoform X1 [Arachis hypogaea]QHN80247.1 uncharacterized protein DS421_20g676710 [Arachis hypogaea]RYQ81793.1 hypothetical protein Ahy_B10g100394 [Arachis hypogaea]